MSAALTIGSSQVKPLLGIKSGKSNQFIDVWRNVFTHLHEVEVGDAVLGFTSLLLLMLLKNPTIFSRWPLFKKYLALSRNALIFTLGMIIAYIFYLNGSEPFRLTGVVREGLPAFGLPPFQNENLSFLDMVRSLGLIIITIPLVSILQSVVIAKAFSKGKILDTTQELIALGLCNILSSFCQSFPVAGSFARTAVNNSSGVKTQLGGIVTVGLILLALKLLTGTFYFIPKATLAAVSIFNPLAIIQGACNTHFIYYF